MKKVELTTCTTATGTYATTAGIDSKGNKWEIDENTNFYLLTETDIEWFLEKGITKGLNRIQINEWFNVLVGILIGLFLANLFFN